LYNEHKVVLQLSVIESFGVSVAEAMSCGCVPVVSAVGGLKEVVKSDYGHLVGRNQTPEIGDAITDAMNTFDEKSVLAQEMVMKNFSVKDREQKLIDFIEA